MTKVIGIWGLGLVVLLAGCGGGGGSGDSNSNATSFNPVVRTYGDTWTRLISTTTNAGSTSTTSTTYTTDGVNADSSFALGITNSSQLSTGSNMVAADGSNLQAGGCIYSPAQQLYSFPLSVGKTWSINYTYACTGAATLTYSGTATVVARETLSTPAGSWDTLKIAYTVTDSGNPATSQTTNATCWWATAIGITVQCNTSYTYTGTANPSNSASTSYVITNYQASTGSKPAPVSNIYPAFSVLAPQVVKSSPSGLSQTNPRPTPIFFLDTQNQSALTDFISKFSAPTFWSVMAQYGVGSPQIGSPVNLSVAAPSVTTQAQISTWLTTQLQTTPSTYGVLDVNSYFVLYYPSSTSINDSNGALASCVRFGGYHGYVHLNSGLNVPYAVIPDCQRGIESITLATSHELMEGSADPYLDSYRTISGDVSWAAAYNGSELNDMCEHSFANSWYTPLALGYPIATVWSNSAASLFHDPCIPTGNLRDITAYFQSVPVLPDTVSITNINNVSGSAKGVTIPVGTSRTIDVQLMSDQAMAGVWRVNAHQAGLPSGTASTLTFSWDKTYGQNGDVLHLTITSTAALPNGAVFEIESYYGGSRKSWIGAVSN
ncbi:MAG TPA: hypothetical protein VIF82_01260 [Burkholderiaceae bacterium]